MVELEITETRMGHRGRYAARAPGTPTVPDSELLYALDGQTMTIDRTFTPPQMRNQGIAARLVARAVADARERGWSIVPQCPYVRAVIDRTPRFQDVLAEGERS